MIESLKSKTKIYFLLLGNEIFSLLLVKHFANKGLKTRAKNIHTKKSWFHNCCQSHIQDIIIINKFNIGSDRIHKMVAGRVKFDFKIERNKMALKKKMS